MQLSSQVQKSGDNSQLVQAETIIIQNGVDEKRVREIFDEKTLTVIKEFSQEANELIRERVKKFGEDFIPKLIKENLVDSLKDPSIQILLLDAQKSAASTERQSDYSLLSELLIHRMKKGKDRYVRSGVSGAIKIVDEVSDEALLGLTVLYSVTFTPNSLGILDGIGVLNQLFSSVLYGELPQGSQWLEQLDLLRAVRISAISRLRSLEDYYAEALSGYINVGIEKFSENYNKALEIIQEARLPKDILSDHELRQGYVRLKMKNINNLDIISLQGTTEVTFNNRVFQVPISVPLSDEQKQAMKEIYVLYDSSIERRKENIMEFFRLWDSFEILSKIKTWRDTISMGVSITPIGKSLAHANAQRHFDGLPEFDSK